MDAVNIRASNAASFTFSRELTPWADFYDLSAGTFRAQMRKRAVDHVVLFEWSTANTRISYTDTKASGTITFVSNPGNSKTITLGSTVVTFVTPSTDHPSGNEVAIAGSLAATLTALKAFLNASVDADISSCTYDVDATVLEIGFTSAGTLGNAFALATDVVGATLSGAKLSGGGGVIELAAEIADIARFTGAYVYDCRFEQGDLRIPLFGGTITFTQGVTRDG